MGKNIYIFILLFLFVQNASSQIFQEDFGTAFASISTVNWPSACRGGSASSFNTSSAPCASSTERGYLLSGFGSFITSSSITIPSAGYELTFEYSFSNSFGFPTVEIRTGASCGTTLSNTTNLTNTSGSCTSETIDLSSFAGQTIYIRFRSNTSSATFFLDEIMVDVSSGGGGGVSCLLDDNFGTVFQSIDATNWPSGSSCRGGTASGFNSSSAPCGSTSERAYQLSGFGSFITSMPLVIPSTGFNLDFEYSYNNSFGFPAVEIRTGGSCGTTLASSTTLANTSGLCNPQTINLDLFAGQTIYIRFRSNTSSASFFVDEITVCGSGGLSGDFKWADNFNDNNLSPDFLGNDGDEACTGCNDWVLNNGASLELVPSGGWNGNSNKTEAFPDNMANVRYVKLERDEFIESPTLDLSSVSGFKISFYAKSSSSGTGGGDSWSSFSDHLRLDIWDGSSWITVKDITEGTSVEENKISAALPFNYFCFTAYKEPSSPGNYYYTAAPNVNTAYFHSDFKFRVVFEGGFSGAPFAWVDDFTFRADADGYSTMIPCGISFWNQPAATSYGQDPGATLANDSERGVELELDNSINIPPLWLSEADDGDQVDQIFGSGESERVVFCVLSEQEINFTFPRVHFFAPSMGNQSSTLSIDNNYSGPGWKYYAVEYISCDLAGGKISEPTDQFVYHYSFEYGNEFIPVFYQLNSSGIESGGGVTSTSERFDAPDVTSSDNCGTLLNTELLFFEGNHKENVIELIWETATENNLTLFEVERSTDGQTFEKTSTQNSLGSGLAGTQYLYNDNNFNRLTPYYYYRLKMIYNDGTYSYSKIIAVELTSLSQDIELFPNPAEEFLNIKIPGLEKPSRVDLFIYNHLGQGVAKHTIAKLLPDQLLNIDTKNLHTGIYTIRILINGIHNQNNHFIRQ
jgi:hypothetical protein